LYISFRTEATTVRRRVERGLEIREAKAEKAAHTEDVVANTLLERLKNVCSFSSQNEWSTSPQGGAAIYNYPLDTFSSLIDTLQTEADASANRELEAKETEEETALREDPTLDRGEIEAPAEEKDMEEKDNSGGSEDDEFVEDSEEEEEARAALSNSGDEHEEGREERKRVGVSAFHDEVPDIEDMGRRKRGLYVFVIFPQLVYS